MGACSLMASEKEYAAAIVNFLERAKQKENTTMCYPITRVELLNIGTLPGRGRIFVVVDDKWVEQN